MTIQFRTSERSVDATLEEVGRHLQQVPAAERGRLLEYGRARIELELELTGGDPSSPAAIREVLKRFGGAEAFARELRQHAPAAAAEAEAPGTLTSCRDCRKEVSKGAVHCPHCGAPFPARARWGGQGYEWKSKAHILGIPLVHVAVGRDAQGKLRVAKGIIAIGQFGVGVITVAQFGVAGLFGIGQFMAAPIAIGQFALGLAAIGQFAIGGLYGLGMVGTGIWGRSLFPPR
jgi:hypothetical protein